MTPRRKFLFGSFVAMWRCPTALAARSRSVLAWSGLSFLLLYLLGAYFVEKGPAKLAIRNLPPSSNDSKLVCTNIRKQPLILMLGSSRTLLMLDAGSMHVNWDGTPAQVFNFGIKGSGPLLELLCLERLLKAGVRPDLLVLEVFPALYNRPRDRSLEEVWFQEGRLRHSEVTELRPFHSDTHRIWRRWLRFRLKPWGGIERSLEDYLDPLGPDRPDHPGDYDMSVIDPYGWEPHFRTGITETQRAYYREIAKNQYHSAMGLTNPRPMRSRPYTRFSIPASKTICRWLW